MIYAIIELCIGRENMNIKSKKTLNILSKILFGPVLIYAIINAIRFFDVYADVILRRLVY